MLTSNEQYLIEQLITKEGYQSYQSLADAVGVSIRTIRNLLKSVEPFLTENNMQLEQKYGVGIRIIPKNTTEQSEGFLPLVDFSAVYRREVIKLLLLLNFRTKTSINKLAEQFYVTKNAVFLDLKVIEKELGIYNLHVIRDYEGTRIEGQRKLIKRAIMDIVHQYGISIMYENQKYIAEESGVLATVLSEEFEQLIQNILLESYEKYSYHFNLDYLQTMILHLLVDIKLFGKKSVENQRNQTIERVGDYFQQRIEDTLGIIFSERYNPNRFQEYCKAFSILDEEDVEEQGADKLVDNYEQIAGIQLKEKDILKRQLNRFLYQSNLRQEYRIAVFHPMLHAFLSNYGPQFVALKLSHQSTRHSAKKFSNDEIAFELVYFLNHSKQYQRTFRVGVAMQSSEELLTFALKKLEKEFPLAFFEKMKTSQKYDLEISINPFSKRINQERTRQIDLNSIQHIERLRNRMEEKYAEKLARKIEHVFMFQIKKIPVLLKKNKESVLNILEKELKENFFVSDYEWLELVEEDKNNPIFWVEKRSALLIMNTPKVCHSILISIDLPVQIKWRNNNDLSRVNKIYLLLSNQVNVDECTTLYQIIQADQSLQESFYKEE